VAAAVLKVPELDGDLSYPLAVQDAAARTGKPVVVLGGLASAVDREAAGRLRAGGIPVLEGTRTGLLAFRHLLDHGAGRPVPGRVAVDAARQRRGRELLAGGQASGPRLMALLAEYGIRVARAERAASLEGALAAAAAVGYPVVLKTDEAGIAHKSDAGGVLLGIGGAAELAAGYAGLAGRLGPRVLVCETVPAGTELALGVVADPGLGPLIVVGAGGVLVELLADRAVALPPVDEELAGELLAGLRVSRLLAGARGAAAADLGAVRGALAGLSLLACELGDCLAALDVNPLICGPHGAVAVDALAIPGSPARAVARPGSVMPG
jgi:acyl-CoA synthetase (NDP forming)